MAQFLAYWRPATLRDMLAGPKQLLNHAASNQYGRVEPNDTVWIVTAWPGGHLVLVGRIPVAEVVDHQTAVRKLRTKDLWEASHHVLAVPDRAEPIREVDVLDIAPSLRFESERDRLDLADGKVDGKQLQTMRTLTPASAELLKQAWENSVELVGPVADATDLTTGTPHVAGFGSAESNKQVERHAIDHVTTQFRKDGWHVESVESQRIGFDLLCRKRTVTRHIEVKGVRGPNPSFIITEAELQRARSDPHFWLCVVTCATSASPRLRSMSGRDAIRNHEFIALVHKAVPVLGRAARSTAG